MIDHEWVQNKGILIIRPQAALRTEDFAARAWLEDDQRPT